MRGRGSKKVLVRAKKVVRRGLVAFPGARRAARLGRSLPHRRLVLSSGLFDREYYQAQRGRTFSSHGAALQDFLASTGRTPYAPNPLFEPEWFAPHDKRPGADALARYLRTGPGKYGPGPLFDPAAYLAQVPEAARHPGGPMGHFLANATPATLLPVPATFTGTPPTWGAARARLLHTAELVADFGRLVAPASTRTWNKRAEREFLRTVGSDAPEADEPVTVSVVMPVRNRAAQVVHAIAGLRAQTFPGWELIVVDDGSTDATARVLAEEAAADRRIHAIRIEPSGVAAARNAGLGEARGRYLAFLDADYSWVPHYLQAMLVFLQRGDHRAARCVVEVLDNGVRGYLCGMGTPDQLLVANHVNLNGVLVEAAVIAEAGGFDESLVRCVDHDEAIRMAKVAPIAFAPFLGARPTEDASDLSSLAEIESDHWEWVVLGKHQVDWDEVEAGLPQRVPGRVSISMPTYRDWRMTLRAVRAVLATCGDHDVEVVVVDNGSNRSVAGILTAAFVGDPRVRLVPLPRNLNFAIASNLGMAVSTGSTVVFLNNDTEVLPGWLDPLLADLDDPQVRGAQPLLLFPDGTIQSAGSLLPGGDVPPMVFLLGHPPEDALRAAPIRLRVVTAAALAVRAREFAALRGFDPIFVNGQEDVDYCLRAVEQFGGQFAVSTDAVVIHHERMTPGRGARIQPNRTLLVQRWRGRLDGSDLGMIKRAGFLLASLDPGPTPQSPDHIRIPRAVLTRPVRQVTDGPGAGSPSLRWALKLAAHPGPRGDGWGDVHFAAALTRALERLGQEVVIDRRESHQRGTATLDDVVLVIRGLEEVVVQPGRVNLLWVISHPDLVTSRELSTFDVVFAASNPWARAMTAAGHPVTPLLQATDPERFHPDLPRPEHADSVLFVGRSRNVLRPIVRDAVAAGLDLSVYGDGWEQFGLAEHVVAQYLPYERVGEAYASAEIVLNDHWADMATQGFISNRIFDAAACGARIVSDPVEGVEEIFGGMVQVYSSVPDLARLCGPEGRDAFPDDETRRTIAKRVGSEHSFDARARQLLDSALAVRQSLAWTEH